jgi:NitT/TauT family transport system substrate-binding protein
MVVGGQSEMVYLPTTLAQQLGFFREQGIDLSIDDVGAGSKSLQAILGGSADVASGFYDHTLHMAAEGKDITAFVTLTRYPGAVLLTSPNGSASITGVKDLKGRTVGVTAPGSSSHFFLNYLLIREGLSPDDVTVIGLGGGRSRVAAIERSRVDAAVVFEPTVSLLQRSASSVRLVADTRTAEGVKAIFGVDQYPSAVFYASASWLQSNTDMARKLARAVRKTLRWVHEHSANEIARDMPESFKAEDPQAYVAAIEGSKQLYSQDGIMEADAAAAVRKVLGTSIEKVRQSQFDIRRTYTNEFLD